MLFEIQMFLRKSFGVALSSLLKNWEHIDRHTDRHTDRPDDFHLMEEDLKHFFAPMIHVPHLLHHHGHAPVATRVHVKELARQILCLIELLASDLGWGGRWEGGME